MATTESTVLNSLLSQKTILEGRIVANVTRINSWENTRKAWWDSSRIWWGLYMDDKDNAFRQSRAADRLANYQAAMAKVTIYEGYQNAETVKKIQNQNALAVVLDGIEGYYEAQATAISQGIPEGGSWQIADAFAENIAAEGEATINLMEAEESKTNTVRNAIIIFGIGLVVFVIWRYIIKRKKS